MNILFAKTLYLNEDVLRSFLTSEQSDEVKSFSCAYLSKLYGKKPMLVVSCECDNAYKPLNIWLSNYHIRLREMQLNKLV